MGVTITKDKNMKRNEMYNKEELLVSKLTFY